MWAIDTRKITKSFHANRVLHEVDFKVRTGEIHALVGENGAGKSTLMRILSGAITDYQGEIRLGGAPVRLAGPGDAEARGVAMIYQELNLVPEMSVAENVYLGREPRGRWGLVDRSRMSMAAAGILADLAFPGSPDTPVSELRVGEQQIVEIARALARNASVLIMDEPTSALSDAEVDNLFRLSRRLRDDGVTVVYISHRLDEIFDLADRVTVLRDGRVVDTLAISDVDRASLIRMMVGREVGDRTETDAPVDDTVVLDVADLWQENTSSTVRREHLVADMSFQVRTGEILGLAGLMGSGRTQVLETIFGASRGKCGGTVSVDRELVDFGTPARAMASGIAYVTEDRQRTGLLPGMSICANVSLASLAGLTSGGIVSLARERRLVSDFMSELDIRARDIDQMTDTLSGGNQQKVVLARWLATNPRVLLLDEPTRGVDVGAKADIYRILTRLRTEGIAMVMVSSDLPELIAMADRILVMREGRPVAILQGDDRNQQMILEYAAAGGPVQAGFARPDGDSAALSGPGLDSIHGV